MILLINTITQFIELLQMKLIDFRSDSYAKYNEDFNKKEPKYEVGYHVEILVRPLSK